MKNTKEAILQVSLKLFAKDGYEAVSVSAIAGALGITKGALYKHYKNKRDIFNQIVRRMEQLDEENAVAFEVPTGSFDKMKDEYDSIRINSIKEFTRAQFERWTEDDFSSSFRKLITLEQYRDPEMSQLYQQYLAGGPVSYMRDLFRNVSETTEEAGNMAIAFYGPVFMLYSIYDGTEDKDMVKKALDNHLDNFGFKKGDH